MTTKWAYLPNAVHIDRVLESVLSNPYHWRVAWSAQVEPWNAPRADACIAARDAVLAQGRYTEWAAAWNTPPTSAVWAHNDALLALCAFDDCAYMLDSDPGELAILAAFGDPRAVLLLAACKTLHSLKESA